jgi:hypothetical protein
MKWNTPDDLRRQVQRLWDNGSLLAARLNDSSLFPLELRLRRPSSRDLAENYDEVRQWVTALVNASRGYGYDITWQRINHRVHGANDLPGTAVVPSEADALRLIQRVQDADRFSRLAEVTLVSFPSLRTWLEAHPLTLLEQAEHWTRVLAVLNWFREHPRSGIYLRQLDIPGVDTKFIETRRKLFMQLLDNVLPDEDIDKTATGARQFEHRYGLRNKPSLIRFRILDPALAINGLTDISVPGEQFAGLSLNVQRVFITENDINGLAFPECPGSLVIFGLGYGLDRLAEIPWLQRTEIHYWGDIDTHGFAILNRLRTVLPRARSFLMDRATLEAHRELWVEEPAGSRFSGELTHLNPGETELFNALRDERFGQRVRLEQERIAYNCVQAAVRAIVDTRSTIGHF